MNSLKVLRIVVLLIIPSSRALSGDNICSRTENYTVTSMEPYTDYVTVKTYGWCFSFPPRCSKTRVEERTNYRLKSENKTRTVEECCDGYVRHQKYDDSEVQDAICVPLCANCDIDMCVRPNKCRCDGEDCNDDCPMGLWGEHCQRVCDCARNVPCDRASGKCQCSPGLKGARCEETCPHGFWGPGCANICLCNDTLTGCHHETGQCVTTIISDTETFTSPIQTETTVDFEWTEILSTSDLESTLNENTDKKNEFEIVTEQIAEDIATTLRPQTTEITTHKYERNPTSTMRPVVVLVSLPERRNLEKSYSKITLNDAYLRHLQDESGRHISTSSRIDYMKTFRKEDVSTTTISLEIAMIVIASIVSLGLTAAAAITIIHVRAKAMQCEPVRPSVYREEKTRSQERDGGNPGRVPTIITSALPQTPICVSPNFGTLLAINKGNDINTYANGSATIALQMSGNFHECLLDSHYDKPQATLTHLHTPLTTNAEHIYDEIPLQVGSLSINKAE